MPCSGKTFQPLQGVYVYHASVVGALKHKTQSFLLKKGKETSKNCNSVSLLIKYHILIASCVYDK